MQKNHRKAPTFFANAKVEFGETELEKLLEWTAAGNTLFVASKEFESTLLDTLGLETQLLFSDFGEDHQEIHQLVNPELSSGSYYFAKDSYATYFSAMDTLNMSVVGIMDKGVAGKNIASAHINVLKQSFGKGTIILSAFPKAFTNYFILRENNKDYVAGLLSYLDSSKPLFMDNYYKQGKSFL